MGKYHAYTTRNGRYVCGNCFNVNAIYSAANMTTAIQHARKLAKIYGKPQDQIRVCLVNPDGSRTGEIVHFTI